MVVQLICAFFVTFFSVVHPIELRLELEGVAQQQGVATIGIQEEFQVKLTVVTDGHVNGAIPIEGLNQFNIHSSGSSRSVAIGPSGHSVEATYSYDVTALREGEFTIGPAKVTYQGKQEVSNKVKVHVVSSPVASAMHSSQQGQSGSSGTVNLALTADKKRIVVGEPVMLTLEVKTQGAVMQVQVAQPQISGFIVKEIAQIAEEMQGTSRIFKKRFVLIPTQAGARKIGPVRLVYQIPAANRFQGINFPQSFFSNFFGPQAQTKQAFSNDLGLQVDQLPVKDDDIDGVGEFNAYTLKVDKNNVFVNEPCTLTLELLGRGNLDQVVTPELELPADSRSYSSKAVVHENLQSGYEGGVKRFEYVVQVTKPGTYVIAPQKFMYFDTHSRSVKTLKTNPVTLKVTVPVGEEGKQVTPSMPQHSLSPSKEQESVHKEELKDIHFIEESEMVSPLRKLAMPWWLVLLLVLLAPVLLFFHHIKNGFVGLFVRIIGGRLNRKDAAAHFRKELEHIEKTQNAGQLYPLFMNIIAHYVGTSVSGLDEFLIKEKLMEKHWQPEKIQEFIGFLHECASHAFASGLQGSTDNQRLFSKARYWVIFLLDTKQGE